MQSDKSPGQMLRDTRGQLDGGRQFVPNIFVGVTTMVFGLFAVQSGLIAEAVAYPLGIAWIILYMFQVPGLVAIGVYDRVAEVVGRE